MDSPNTGATIFAPGSNRRAEPLVIPKDQIHPEKFIEPVLKAGDAFLFESRIYHGAAINTLDRIAKIAMFGYHYTWVRPDYYMHFYDGEARPSAAVLENLDDIGRQRCAGDHPVAACRRPPRAPRCWARSTASCCRHRSLPGR